MTRDDRERLDDIAEAIRVVRSHVAAGAPVDDRLKRDAILYNLVIIGEAVKSLTDSTRALQPAIPWKQIAGLRDLLTHQYFRIEMSEIGKILERDLTPLEAAIRDLRRQSTKRPSSG